MAEVMESFYRYTIPRQDLRRRLFGSTPVEPTHDTLLSDIVATVTAHSDIKLPPLPKGEYERLRHRNAPCSTLPAMTADEHDEAHARMFELELATVTSSVEDRAAIRRAAIVVAKAGASDENIGDLIQQAMTEQGRWSRVRDLLHSTIDRLLDEAEPTTREKD